MNTTHTVHGVLAGAYRGKGADLRNLLTHASLDDGSTAICRKVKTDALADAEESEVTCPTCIARLAKMAR